MQNVYVNKRGDYALVPYKIYGTKAKCQTWLKNGGVICEWFDLNDITNNHIHYIKFTRKYLLDATNEMTEDLADNILKSYEKYKYKKDVFSQKKNLINKEKTNNDRIESEYTQHKDIGKDYQK